MRGGAVPCLLVMVAAADRAAVTYEARGRRWGGGGFSKRSPSSPDPFSRRVAGNSLVFSFRLAHPREVNAFPNKLAGRGGSVSRRDHTQVYRRRAHTQAEPTPKKHTPPTPAALRERGSGGEALLSEKRPLPQNLPTLRLFEREREGGGFSTRKASSLAIIPRTLWRFDVGRSRRLCQPP